jgi:hypothetical protein
VEGGGFEGNILKRGFEHEGGLILDWLCVNFAATGITSTTTSTTHITTPIFRRSPGN